VREGTETIARMLSCFVPFTAEEAWEPLGEPASALVAQEAVTCVVQVAGKVRDRLEVPLGIVEDELRELAYGPRRSSRP
jgi:leucyl-tRNA synthetase